MQRILFNKKKDSLYLEEEAHTWHFYSFEKIYCLKIYWWMQTFLCLLMPTSLLLLNLDWEKNEIIAIRISRDCQAADIDELKRCREYV